MEWIDPVAETWQDTVRGIYEWAGEPGRKVEDFLHGKFLGHPLHPMMVHLPIGAWMLAAVLDLFSAFPVARYAADLSILVGLIAAIPAVLTGSTDYYVYGDKSIRRIGGLHALLNLLAFFIYAIALGLRHEGARGFGLFLSYTGFVVLSMSGYLGGLLVYEKRIGANHAPEPEDESAPDDFVWVTSMDQLPENKPTRVRVQDVNVVLVRQGEVVFAMADACAHMGASLAEGKLEEGCLVCPWHESKFRLRDGACLNGPSVFNQPKFPVRIDNGQVWIKAVRTLTPTSRIQML